jgi:peptidoglycan/xylan/chitin deacetylase (PgdA/CDA1 family)
MPCTTMVILTYHKIRNIENFEKQINYLVRKKYNLLSLSDFVVGYSARTLTAKDVLITFDDGDFSILDNALPVLKKFSCPAVAFVVTGLIGTDVPFWWDEIEFHTQDAGKVQEAKRVTNNDRLNLLKNIRSSSKKPPLKYRQLTVEELRKLEQGGVTIANHSHTHPMLDKLDGPEIAEELQESVTFLRANGFAFCDIFAYPNGNWTVATEKVLKGQKMRMAFLFDHRLNVAFDTPFRISRLSVNDHTPLWKYILILRGWHSRMLPLTKMIRKFWTRK